MMNALLVVCMLTASTSKFLRPEMGEASLVLAYGITLLVPSGWRADRSTVQENLGARSAAVLKFESLTPDSSGHLILIAGPAGRGDEASLEISIMPTGVSQEEMRGLTPVEINQAGRDFRTEIEGAIKRSGLTMVKWNGTERVRLGGRLALLGRYRFRYPPKRDMVMESYGVYLGRRSIQIRLQYSVELSSATRAEVEQVRSSIRLTIDHIDR